MASISTYLQKILEAVYGEEVRGSIHDALAAMNVESSSAMEYAATAKDSAQAAAASAGSSASTAAEKASEAIASAESAKDSETNAKASETSVAQQASEAAAAAADAKNSVTIVTDLKTAAEAAKAAAESAEEHAKSSETAAAASALSAQQYSGKPPEPRDGTWWIWDASQQKYVDSGKGCELHGPAGNGILDIQLTTGDHSPGTTDIYTVTMTDKTTTTISVYNGRNGTGAGDVLGISFDLVLPASGWVNGELTIADSRLLALTTYKYFLIANGASCEEYIACNVRPMDITTNGFITFKNDAAPTGDLTVNVIRLELSASVV